jgi:hypothetical protein
LLRRWLSPGTGTRTAGPQKPAWQPGPLLIAHAVDPHLSECGHPYG